MFFLFLITCFITTHTSQICDNSTTLVNINFASGPALIDTISSTTSYTIGNAPLTAIQIPRVNTTYDNSLVDIQLTVTGSDVTNINQLPTLIYNRTSSRNQVITRFGYTTYVVFTGAFSVHVDGSGTLASFSQIGDSFIGIFNDTNGIAFGVREVGVSGNTNPTPSFQAYLQINGSLNTFSPTGPTPTIFGELNLYRIVISNSSSAFINLDYYDGHLGVWQTMKTFTNTDLSPYTVQNFINLPVGIETRFAFNGSGVPSLQLPFAQLSAVTSGWLSYITGHDQCFTQSLLASVNSTEQHIITIQNKSTFGGTTNNAVVQPINLASLTTTNNSFGIIYTVYKNATVTGTSYQNQDAQNSAVQYTTAGTYSIGTGTQVFSLHSTSNSGNIPEFTQYLSNIYLSPGETLTITGKTLFNQTDSIFLALGWKEAQLLGCYGN